MSRRRIASGMSVSREPSKSSNSHTHLPCRPSSLDILIVIAVDGAQSFCLRLVDLTVIGCSCCGGCQGRVVGVLLLLPLSGRHRGAWREVALHPDLVAQHEELEV